MRGLYRSKLFISNYFTKLTCIGSNTFVSQSKQGSVVSPPWSECFWWVAGCLQGLSTLQFTLRLRCVFTRIRTCPTSLLKSRSLSICSSTQSISAIITSFVPLYKCHVVSIVHQPNRERVDNGFDVLDLVGGRCDACVVARNDVINCPLCGRTKRKLSPYNFAQD